MGREEVGHLIGKVRFACVADPKRRKPHRPQTTAAAPFTGAAAEFAP